MSKERKIYLSKSHISILQHALDICESDYQDINDKNSQKTLKEISRARDQLDRIVNQRKASK